MLVKIGNIKIGELKKGKPIVREGLLVTQAVKDNEEEFFLPFPGFSRKGVEELSIVLPFDDPELNFETGYVSFATIRFYDKDKENNKEILAGEAPYIIKEIKEKEKTFIIGQPLNEYAGEFKAPFIFFGETSEELIQELKMKLTGILRCMIEGVSNWGEVFHFKTKSKSTINAIKTQLKTIDKITKGKTAGLVLKMKPYRKQFNDIIFPFVDIAIPASNFKELNEKVAEHLEVRSISNINIEELEKEFKNRYPHVMSMTKYNPESMEIIIEENEDIVHEIEFEEEHTEETKEQNSEDVIEEIVKILTENFTLKNNVLPLLRILIRRVYESTNEKEKAAEILKEELSQFKDITTKNINEIILKYS